MGSTHLPKKKKKNEGVIPQNFVKRGGLKIR